MRNIADLISPSIDSEKLIEACDNNRLSIDILATLLDLRKRFEGSGNRRPLYHAFDEALTGALHHTSETIPAGKPVGGLISLRQIAFKNWKVFGNTTINFPEHRGSKPVILIGGKNGYGKTSLLEGILFCLFGKSVLAERARFLGEPNSAGARSLAYRQFIQNAFHRPARDRGETSALVRTEWDTPDGILVVERRWYFDESGEMHEEDETLTLFTGADHQILPIPDDVAPEEYYQSEVDRRLMTIGAAFFFLFDAEQTSSFSERNLDEQVKAVIQGAFGLWRLRAVIDDLRSYSRDRVRRHEKNGDDHNRIVSQLLSLKDELKNLTDEGYRIGEDLEEAQRGRDASLTHLAELQGSSGTYASMHELLERRQALSMEHARAIHEFAGLSGSTLPLAVVGKKLRTSVLSALKSDNTDDDGTSAVFQNDAALNRLLRAIEERGNAEPAIRDQITLAWNALADLSQYSSAALHYPFLTPALRSGVIERLQRHQKDYALLAEAADRITKLIKAISDTEAAIEQNGRRDVAIDEIRKAIAQYQEQVDRLNGSRKLVQEKLALVEETIATLRATLDGDENMTIDGTKSKRPIDHALSLADKIELVANEIMPDCFNKISKAITEIYSALAHKGSIARIAVDSTGRVSLYDHAGQDVRSLDRSAGERQIFAMALIAAIGNLSTIQLPSIIDTPLARLDSEHRERLLNYFSSRSVQTILLSQPEEISGEYLELIRDRIGGWFLLEYRQDGIRIGNSVARSGYFTEAAA